jgi:hypothetical protein
MRKIRLLLLALLIPAISAISFAQFGVSIAIAPPALPVYEQPMAPADGYLWTPGYWSYGNEGYFWVPGTWAMPPEVGLLWTPGYWGWGGGAFAWNSGYWGPHVGFYGGVNYGFGYGGEGYGGGRWDNGHFFYNRSVNNVNITNIHNTYNTTVINNTTVNHVSYNGGAGGIAARPTPAEETATHEQHREPTALQAQHVQAASTNHALLASVNQGRPAIAATAKPGEFSRGVVPAKQAGAPYKAENRPAAPSAASKAVPKPENSTQRPDNKAANNVQRPETAHNTPATHASVPRPPTESNKPSAGRPATAAHAQPAPRPQTAPRPETRPESAPHPQTAAHAQPAPRPQTAPRPEAHPESAPRPVTAARAQPVPRPAEKEAHPAEERPRQ